MSVEIPVKTSLAVGFPEGRLPEAFVRYRGREHRSIPVSAEFPYEDSQFEVVLLDGSAVSAVTVREAHRVLRPDGRLFFIVPEKTRQQDGFALPDVYSIVRDGFNIIETERPPWWLFGCRGHTLTITARKKTWKSYKGLGCRNLSYHSLFASTK